MLILFFDYHVLPLEYKISIVYLSDLEKLVMKLILSSFLIILILVIGVSQADAYDGKVNVTIEGKDFIEGDKIPISIVLIGSIEHKIENIDGEIVETDVLEGDPDRETPLEIILIEKGTGLTVEQITSTPDWIYDDITFAEPVWKTSFEFDTSSDKLSPKTTYYIKAVFDDKNDITKIFAFSPQQIPEQVVEDVEIMTESKLEQPKEIPSWVKDIFVFYAEDRIDDKTLLNAIEYLLSVEVITIR